MTRKSTLAMTMVIGVSAAGAAIGTGAIASATQSTTASRACTVADIHPVYDSTPPANGSTTRWSHVRQDGATIVYKYTTDGTCTGNIRFIANWNPDGGPGGGPTVDSVVQPVGKAGTLTLPIPTAKLFKDGCNAFAQYDVTLVDKAGKPLVKNHPIAGVRLKLEGDCKVSTPTPTPSTPATTPRTTPSTSKTSSAVVVPGKTPGKSSTPAAAVPTGKVPNLVQTDGGLLSSETPWAPVGVGVVLLIGGVVIYRKLT